MRLERVPRHLTSGNGDPRPGYCTLDVLTDNMTRKRIGLVVIVALVVAAGVMYYARANTPDPVVSTQPITRGNVVETVGATGTLEAVTTVQVGTQVSGTVQALYADFNTIVRKGQVI